MKINVELHLTLDKDDPGDFIAEWIKTTLKTQADREGWGNLFRVDEINTSEED